LARMASVPGLGGLGGDAGDAFTVLGFVVLLEGFGVLEDLLVFGLDCWAVGVV
jgi:hypothetical protein